MDASIHVHHHIPAARRLVVRPPAILHHRAFDIHLLYVKASLTGDENPYVREYAEQHPLFPHESTANQFFTEPQFEAYRSLGYHAASRAIAEHAELAGLAEPQAEVATT